MAFTAPCRRYTCGRHPRSLALAIVRGSATRSPGAAGGAKAVAAAHAASQQNVTMDAPPRLFLLGAGFSKPAGLPLAAELAPLVLNVADTYLATDDGYSHLRNAFERYETFLEETDPGSEFDLEAFSAWLDWEHVLRLKGKDTFSEHGNEAGLQLRWAIGKVLFDRCPDEAPPLYVEFARHLTTRDRVMTLNYDVVLERALDAVALPYRRFPGRFSEVYESHAVWDPDEPDELVISKLHGSIDWSYSSGPETDQQLDLRTLVEGPRRDDDPLNQIAVIPSRSLGRYYGNRNFWWRNPTLLMPPSTAKPLARSALVPLWDGIGRYAYLLGGFTVIGCSLPPADPYVRQLVHHIATDYAYQRPRELPWPQCRMKLVDFRPTRVGRHQLMERFRFMSPEHTDTLLDGFTAESLAAIFDGAL